MKMDSQIEIASYVADLIFTLLFVFEKIVHPDALLEWLQPMLMDGDQRAMLLHEEPCYVAADFLEIDRFAPAFRGTERKYLRFRSEFLHQSPSAPAPQLEATLQELLATRDYLSKSNVRYVDFLPTLTRSIIKHEPITEVALPMPTPTKNIPHHPEKHSLAKTRTTAPLVSRHQKIRRPRRPESHPAAAHLGAERVSRKNYAALLAGHDQ
jgi:hypothetical protein